jgi:Fe-Mn family superoxide dismutase
MFKLPELPYAYDALEPHIDAMTMEIHHTKHHAGYVEKLNKALEGETTLQGIDLDKLLTTLSDLPDSTRTAVRNNGGGHANHSLFWKIMSPDGGGSPEGDLADRIRRDFDSFDAFRKQFTDAATGRFGSGWVWLMIDNERLVVGSTPNQDSPLMEGKTPLLGLDVWEHAYYLKYQNRRADYVKEWWSLIDWAEVGMRYESTMSMATAS